MQDNSLMRLINEMTSQRVNNSSIQPKQCHEIKKLSVLFLFDAIKIYFSFLPFNDLFSINFNWCQRGKPPDDP